MKVGKTGVRKGTPEKIEFGAGTIHVGLKYSGSKWNFEESIYGATQGGSNLLITPILQDIEADGVLVKTKGMTQKVGETATLEINMLELTPDMIKRSVIGKEVESPDPSYTAIETKADIEEGDYLENIAYVGKLLNGKNVIAILDNALCTSGLGRQSENKKELVQKLTFECSADIEGDLDTLPCRVYYPKGEE